ncbi:MAG: hypothetical protein HPY53_10430 [Brevinematales bacterium]|nr:hypothetical protein [Brevinematales bacterium]
MKDFGISYNKSCTCTQGECPIRGNCVLCVQNHLDHKRHIPECIQNLIRPEIRKLSAMVEYEVSDTRPGKGFWETFDKEKFIGETTGKHVSKKGKK